MAVVVGFDGSPSSRDAVLAAERLADRENGTLHVVFVGHVPFWAASSAAGYAGVKAAFESVGADLQREVAGLLDQSGAAWSFERRDGAIAHGLFSAAEELAQAHPHRPVQLVVGSPQHALHRVGGSVASHLGHQNQFALTVVPARRGEPEAAAGKPHDDSNETKE